MCDTFVVTPEFTESKNMIFGKNSDREPNEAHSIVKIPRQKFTKKTQRATYIEIPAPKETFSIILGKPFQMFGAEMGANEFGVVIGNEAVFTKVKFDKKTPGLTGMDMIRIALERTKSAETALELITKLLEEYGQNAWAGFKNKGMYYHNSFIIADSKDAFVLETAGKEWAAIKVKGFRSISNGITIESEYDYSSKGLIDFAIKNHFMKKTDEFNFRKVYSDTFYTYFGKCVMRHTSTTKKGELFGNSMNIKKAIEILRLHNKEEPIFHPANSDMSSICMHATGIFTPSQTTGSMIAEIRKKGISSYWLTGTSAPCISIFKPFYFTKNSLSLEDFPVPTEYPNQSLWWAGERLHRKVIRNYKKTVNIFHDELESFQNRLIKDEKKFLNNKVKLDKFSIDAYKESKKFLEKWTKQVKNIQDERYLSHPLYRLHWKHWNKECNFSSSEHI